MMLKNKEAMGADSLSPNDDFEPVRGCNFSHI